jgi:hypothetical protein
MPLPKPNKGEKKEQFISRCMKEISVEFENVSQRYAVCIDCWLNHFKNGIGKFWYKIKKKMTNDGTFNSFVKEYKEKQFQSYSDYPDSVKNNAKRGIELNEQNGNKCATQVGKVRAQQLANGEPISEETIKRMYSYLSRAETYYDNADDTSDCGYISFLLWGGKSALSWSESKMKQIERQSFKKK